MTTYRKAFEVLRDAINDPDNVEKLEEAKSHPRLKKTLAGFTTEDLQILNKVAKASGSATKCGQE
jgi:hypothetical protein